MTGVLDKMFQPVKSAVDAAREWLGPRTWMTGTNASEAFGGGATYLYCLHQDSKAIDDANAGKGPKCELPELLDLAKFMADVRRGLDGWETQQGIRAIEAAAEGKFTTTIQTDRRRGDD